MHKHEYTVLAKANTRGVERAQALRGRTEKEEIRSDSEMFAFIAGGLEDVGLVVGSRCREQESVGGARGGLSQPHLAAHRARTSGCRNGLSGDESLRNLALRPFPSRAPSRTSFPPRPNLFIPLSALVPLPLLFLPPSSPLLPSPSSPVLNTIVSATLVCSLSRKEPFRRPAPLLTHRSPRSSRLVSLSTTVAVPEHCSTCRHEFLFVRAPLLLGHQCSTA